MSYLPPEILTEIRMQLSCPDLMIDLRPQWGSQEPGSRQKIHSAIKALESSGLEQELFSISHTQGLGGFIYSPSRNSLLGFDIEVNARVTPALARRVCESTEELLGAPSASSLWVAKEATFKALRGVGQPQVMSAIKLDGWCKKTSHLETFCLSAIGHRPLANKGLGLVFVDNIFSFGFFLNSHKLCP